MGWIQIVCFAYLPWILYTWNPSAMDECLRRGGVYCVIDRWCINKNRVCDRRENCDSGEDESPRACTLKQQCESNWSLSEGCFNRCKPGYFGNYCEEKCSEKCMNGTCNSSSGICQDCNPGYFGKYCEQICSEECLNGICNSTSGICKDCKRTYLESCSLRCSQGCRQRNGFPQCNRQSGKCLHGCTPWWSGRFCWDESSLQTTTIESTDKDIGNSFKTTELADKESLNSFKTTMIVISAILTVIVVVVGSVSFVLARKGFIRQQNDRMEQGRVFPDGVTPKQQPSGSRRPQSSKVYADINEETMEYYHHICERNSPDNNDEINVTNDPDIEIMPSEDFTDESESRRIVTKSEDKDDLDSTEETGRSVTQFNGDLDHVCKSDSTSGVNPKRSELVSTNDVLDLKTHCQINMAENRQMKAAKCCNEGGNIFVDLGQFQVDYIHAIASEECELLDNKNRSSNCTSSL